MTKRSFFKSIMGAVAAVALAPEIAFGARLALPEAVAPVKWAGRLVIAWGNGWFHSEYALRDTQQELEDHLNASRVRLEKIEPGIKSWHIVAEESDILSMPDGGYVRHGPCGIA